MSQKLVIVTAFKSREGQEIPIEAQILAKQLTQGFAEMMEKIGLKTVLTAGMTADAVMWQPTRTHVGDESVAEALAYRLAHPDEVGDQPLRLMLFIDDEDLRETTEAMTAASTN